MRVAQRMQLVRASMLAFWLTAFISPADAQPKDSAEPCKAGLPEIEAALQTSMLDHYTAAQVADLRRELDAATAAQDTARCQAAIAQLQEILHLNH